MVQPTLVLADGSRIGLDSAADGVVARQGNTVVRKQNHQLIYEASDTPAGQQKLLLAYNSVATPRGSRYQVVLPDGSTVWLNAASVLRLPVRFSGAKRGVDLSGEAYFDVAKDAARPFRVQVLPRAGSNGNGAVVEVLGTRFNINAYQDEPLLKTTLLEGQVAVTPLHNAQPATPHARVLQPGQQAQMSVEAKEAGLQVHGVDVEEVMAWKNNLFNFNGAGVEIIMREIARWYDVEVVYEGSKPVQVFSGKISRSADLTTVLKILEQSSIRFRVQDKRIIVRS